VYSRGRLQNTGVDTKKYNPPKSILKNGRFSDFFFFGGVSFSLTHSVVIADPIWRAILLLLSIRSLYTCFNEHLFQMLKIAFFFYIIFHLASSAFTPACKGGWMVDDGACTRAVGTQCPYPPWGGKSSPSCVVTNQFSGLVETTSWCCGDGESAVLEGVDTDHVYCTCVPNGLCYVTSHSFCDNRPNFACGNSLACCPGGAELVSSVCVDNTVYCSCPKSVRPVQPTPVPVVQPTPRPVYTPPTSPDSYGYGGYTPPPSQPPASSSRQDDSGAIIGGIVGGVVAVLCACGLVGFFFYRRGRAAESLSATSQVRVSSPRRPHSPRTPRSPRKDIASGGNPLTT
jgi:hypothetical protein